MRRRDSESLEQVVGREQLFDLDNAMGWCSLVSPSLHHCYVLFILLFLLLLPLGPLTVHLIVKTFFLPAHFLQPMLSPLLLPHLGNKGEIVSLRSTVTAQVIQLSTDTKASNNLSNALFLHHTAPHIVIITVGDLVPSQVGDIPIPIKSLKDI